MEHEPVDGIGAIGAMPLYVDIDRVVNQLRAAGVGPDDPLTPDQLYPLDQLHYYGVDAVRAAAGLIGLGRQSRVLDVGAGLGGPARYLAHTVGCHVTALELQREMHQLAASLTKRCQLNGRVTHVRGDALTYPLEVGGFDAAVSWMAVHHMPDRPRLLNHLMHAIRPGGHIYIEDLMLRDVSSREAFLDMRRLLHAMTLTDAEDFAQELEDAGFEEIDLTDLSSSWATFVDSRTREFRAARARHAEVLGEPTTARLDEFFSGVSAHFASGSLGGARLSALRP